MEKWKVVGWRDVNFTDQQNGKQVIGISLFLARESQDDKVHGLEVQKLFFNPQYVPYKPTENEFVIITYNRYGKVASIVPEV